MTYNIIFPRGSNFPILSTKQFISCTLQYIRHNWEIIADWGNNVTHNLTGLVNTLSTFSINFMVKELKRKRIKILTPKQMLWRLPIELLHK